MSEPLKEPDGSVLTISELSDGRIIAQRKKRLAEGGWVSTHEDVTERHETEKKVKEMARSDALTGLSNRVAFKQRLEQCLADTHRHFAKYAVLYLDLDHFKVVNDTLGHPLGDKLLREVARENQSRHPRGRHDCAARRRRIRNHPARLSRAARRHATCGTVDRRASARSYTIDGNEIEIGASVGISLAPDDSLDGDELIRNADMALYHAKANRGSFSFFKPAMDEQVRSRRKTEGDCGPRSPRSNSNSISNRSSRWPTAR